MNSLLIAVSLSSCMSFAEWTGYYYQLINRSEVRIPTSWMVEGMPEHEQIVEHAASYPGDMTRALVELYAEEHCVDMSDN